MRKLQSIIPTVPQNLQKKLTRTCGIRIFSPFAMKGMESAHKNTGDVLCIWHFQI